MPDPAHPTTVLYEQARPRLRRTHVREMALRLSETVARGRSFTCLVAPSQSLRRLNREFRGKDSATDVLSFPVAIRPASFLGDLAAWLIVEFVPKDDPMVQRLLASREDIFLDYTRDGFERAFSTRFSIERTGELKGSRRTLYLMRGKSR